jgi:dynein heavy chain 1
MPPTFSYILTTHLAYTPSNSTTLALIKRGPTLDPITPLATQLHLLNLFGSDETPYESLHAVVSNGVKPWFDAFVGARGQGKDGDNKMGKFCWEWSMSRTHGVIPGAGVSRAEA